MNSTYAQKSSTIQKAADSKAASVLDSSAQGESLQRKADLCNSPIQCYGMTLDFQKKHSHCNKSEARQRCLNRGQVNSVLTLSAQKKLDKATDTSVRRIVGVDCVTWYNYGAPDIISKANHCAVVINDEGNMDHLESSGPRMVGRVPGWINYKDLQ